MRSLPPLNALHTFEVVARHLSFQQAAEELDVTSTAVSHQIKLLENHLGVTLFRRRPRPLTLTEAGHLLSPVVSQSFDAIAAAISPLRQIPESQTLTVSITTVFAAKWLLPRLSNFQQLHPEVDLRLQTSNDVVDLQRHTVDLAIRYGRGNYPGLVVCKLMSDVFLPVCSPRLLQDQHPIRKPDDLVHHCLLHFEWSHFGDEAPNWKNWFKTAGLTPTTSKDRLKFNEESLAIQAAIADQGVALCSNIHVADDVSLGFLVQPLEVSLIGFNYSAVYLENHPKKTLILKFVDWLVEMADNFSHSSSLSVLF
jgi:LysR family transcriptional regulator, glycine cleavage system transcriptional activator